MFKQFITSKLFLIISIIIAVYISGRLIVFHQLENVIRQELADLEQQGIDIQVDGLKVGPWQNRVQFDSVRVRFSEGYGQDNYIQAHSGAIILRGISLLQAVLNKTLHIRAVQITQPFIQTMIEPEGQNKRQKVKNNAQPALKSFFFKHVKIEQGRWRLYDNTKTPARVTTLDEVHLTNFFIQNNPDGPLEWQVGKTNVASVLIDLPKDYYTFQVKEIFYDADAKELNIDTIKLTPLYNKKEFAAQFNKENTRLTAVIPYIKVEECELKSSPRFTLNAAEARLKFYLESYLDKRYPFKNEADKVLPIEFLQNLPITVRIDTVHLVDSYAEHEEFPEIGEESGKVFFTKLNATIANLSTVQQKDLKKLPTLSATAMFMGVGDLRATFGFPNHPNGNYYASGTMHAFSFNKLNDAITLLARACVESGYLNWVKFNFEYNDDRSDGKVEMNYKDLKVAVLKKDDPTKKAGLKNFVLNTFILKEDLDEKLKTEDRIGTIQFYRDRRRSLFYYWWKSVLSGVLSVYSIDKVPEPKDRETASKQKDN